SAFILLLSWVLFSAFFPSALQDMHYYIIKPQADISAYFLRLLGYEIDQDYMVNGCEAMLVFAGHGSICIGTGCSGLELFLLFFGFILLMRGRLIDKLWFVPVGLLGILVLNIIRIVALSVIYYYKPEYLEFNHKYTFVIIVYGAIFGLWVLWVNKFADSKE
ncbi:MAG: archaeosortase/exosortase family protein, partial [Cyclobacteriaceae bacterium]|nr:archaeosortase/exosortase family protein [Cyclobacteriaceae bacterium]